MPGKQQVWTLQHYGAYVVDDTQAPGFDIAVEDDPNGSRPAEFQKDWSFAMEQKVANNTAPGSRNQFQRRSRNSKPIPLEGQLPIQVAGSRSYRRKRGC